MALPASSSSSSSSSYYCQQRKRKTASEDDPTIELVVKRPWYPRMTTAAERSSWLPPEYIRDSLIQDTPTVMKPVTAQPGARSVHVRPRSPTRTPRRLKMTRRRPVGRVRDPWRVARGSAFPPALFSILPFILEYLEPAHIQFLSRRFPTQRAFDDYGAHFTNDDQIRFAASQGWTAELRRLAAASIESAPSTILTVHDTVHDEPPPGEDDLVNYSVTVDHHVFDVWKQSAWQAGFSGAVDCVTLASETVLEIGRVCGVHSKRLECIEAGMEGAAVAGNLDAVQRMFPLARHHGLSLSDAYGNVAKSAAASGHLPIVQWLWDRVSSDFKFNPSPLRRWVADGAANAGQADVMQWLIDSGHVKVPSERLLEKATTCGHLACLQIMGRAWSRHLPPEQLRFRLDKVLLLAVSYGHADVAAWAWTSLRSEWDTREARTKLYRLVLRAASHIRLQTVDWAWSEWIRTLPGFTFLSLVLLSWCHAHGSIRFKRRRQSRSNGRGGWRRRHGRIHRVLFKHRNPGPGTRCAGLSLEIYRRQQGARRGAGL
jgi:hypothetical protein